MAGHVSKTHREAPSGSAGSPSFQHLSTLHTNTVALPMLLLFCSVLLEFLSWTLSAGSGHLGPAFLSALRWDAGAVPPAVPPPAPHAEHASPAGGELWKMN